MSARPKRCRSVGGPYRWRCEKRLGHPEDHYAVGECGTASDWPNLMHSPLCAGCGAKLNPKRAEWVGDLAYGTRCAPEKPEKP